MAEFRLPANSRIAKGITHAAPAGARAVRQVRIYRFNPDSGENPRMDTFGSGYRQLRADGARCPDRAQVDGGLDASPSGAPAARASAARAR